jgi:hypothetical protein
MRDNDGVNERQGRSERETRNGGESDKDGMFHHTYKALSLVHTDGRTHERTDARAQDGRTSGRTSGRTDGRLEAAQLQF